MVKQIGYYKIFKDFSISSSHRLWNDKLTTAENIEVFGKCSNLPSHGHNYKIRITLRSKKLKNGMIRNFNEVKKIFLERIDASYDHQYLNNCEPFFSENILTTAENMCKIFYDRLKEDVPELYSITIWETDTSCAEYYKE